MEEEKRSPLQRMIQARDEVASIAETDKNLKDPRAEIRNRAKEARLEYVHKTAQETVDGYEVTRPEELDPKYVFEHAQGTDAERKEKAEAAAEFIKRTLSDGQNRAITDSAAALSGNLEEILGSLPRENLEALARVKEVVKNAPEQYKRTIESYASLFSLEGLARAYDPEKAPEDGKLRVLYGNILSSGAEIVQKEKSSGLSEADKEMAILLNVLGVRAGFVNKETKTEYVRRGFEYEIKKARAEYEKSGNIHDAVKGTLRNMTNGDAENFSKALGLIYSAARGKISIREPDYTENIPISRGGETDIEDDEELIAA